MNKEKTIKTVSLVFIDIFFMAITYIVANLIFNKADLTIDPNFTKFIPLLILIKIGIYFIAGLYKEETRGMVFEISCVTLANIIVFILVRFILKVGVSTYLQIIALTVDIIVETISRSLLLSVSEEELEEDNIQVFDDPYDYSEELRLNKMKKELIEIKNQEQQQKEETKQALEELKEKENQLKQKEEQLKSFEHTLSLKELNIQKELEKLEKEKEEKIKIEQEIKKQEQLRKQRLQQKEILDGVLDNIKTIHTSLNERSKVVDLQEHNLMMKMYDITQKEIEQKTSKEQVKKRKHLSDKELLEETYRKIGQKRKRVNPYTKSKSVQSQKQTSDNKKIKTDKNLSEALKNSSLLNTSKEEKENDEFMKFLFNGSNLKEENNVIKIETKKKDKNKQSNNKTNVLKNNNAKNNNSTTKDSQIKTPLNNKKTTKNVAKQNNTNNVTKINKNIKPTKKDQIDLMFSEDDFDKIADLIDKM
ncbi:hypothetical protein [Anaerofustis butyriciformans]|uniref:hypothetical protein n=1 Tax=Anaerofustis butyriciformans TaxID=3108533 RepID=UPI003F8AA16E